MHSQFSRLCLVYLTFGLINCYDDWVYKTIRDEEAKSEMFDECGICKLMTDSFVEAMKKTNNNMEPNYEDSELRMTEIQEMLCVGLQHGKNRCLGFAQEREEDIEYWWKNVKGKESIYQHLCIRKLKLCCLAGSYGPKCHRCPGAPDAICHKNGKCSGEGTRFGDGKCICEPYASGDECEICGTNYTKIDFGQCAPCDQSCQNGCFAVGKEGCNPGCSDGFREDENKICQDKDECVEDPNKCGDGTFCENSYGSYSCTKCNKACKTCIGPGNECLECKEDYVKENEKCIPFVKSKRANRIETIKYLAYTGITILCCLLMSKTPLVGMIITISLSVYIGLSEYANLNSLSGPLHAFEQLFL